MLGVKKLQGLEEGLAQDPVWLCQQLLLDLRKGPTRVQEIPCLLQLQRSSSAHCLRQDSPLQPPSTVFLLFFA